MNVLFPLAVVAMAGLATTVFAEPSFPLAEIQNSTSQLRFDHVSSDADGVVEIYDYNGHVIGRLIGSRPLEMGVNSDLRVTLIPPPPVHDAVAVLVVNGVPVDSQVIEFRRGD